MFVAAQLVGAVIGALLLLATIPDAADTNLGAHALGSDVSISMGLVMELMVTFVLVFVIFATAVDPALAELLHWRLSPSAWLYSLTT